MRVAITGGTGFIGGTLASNLCSRGVEVVVVDSAPLSRPPPGPRLKVVKGDVRDEALLASSFKGCDAVAHLAALKEGHPPSYTKEEMESVNVDGTRKALRAAESSGVGAFILASTVAVYGECSGPASEDVPLSPMSGYGKTKVAAEDECLKSDGPLLRTASLRLANVYGPSEGAGAGVVSLFAKAAARRRSLQVYGDGGQTRDFVHVQDVVAAFESAFARSLPRGSVFNVGTGKGTTLKQVIAFFQNAYGGGLEVTHLPPRKEIRYSVADISKARSQLGYSPSISLEEGIQECAAAALASSLADR